MPSVNLTQTGNFKSIHLEEQLKNLLDNKSKVLVVTHRDCMDGFMCASIAMILKERLGLDLEFVLTTYGEQQIKDVLHCRLRDFDVVIFADMQPSRETLEKFVAVLPLFIFDHHPNNSFLNVIYAGKQSLWYGDDTSKLPLRDAYGWFNSSMSGAMLFLLSLTSVHTEKFNIMELFNLTAIVSDQDTHSLKIQDSQEFVGMLFSHLQTLPSANEKIEEIKNWYAVADKFADVEGIEQLSHFSEYLKKRNVIKHIVGVQTSSAALLSMTINSGSHVSFYLIYGHYDYRSQYMSEVLEQYVTQGEICVAVICPGKGVSIRSTANGIALLLASNFGGGGHPNASGIPEEKITDFLAHIAELPMHSPVRKIKPSKL